MGGFEQLPQAIQEGLAYAPILPEEVAFGDEELSDETALNLVVSDTTIAERYVQGKNLSTGWDYADDVYRAYIKPSSWPGTNVPRSTLRMFLVLEIIEKMMPTLFLAFF